MESKIRPAKENDWLAVLALLDQVQPDSKEANREWWRQRQHFNAHTFRRRHYVAEITQPDGSTYLTAYAGIEEGPEPREFRLFLVMVREQLGSLGETLYAGLMHDLASLDARVVTASIEIHNPMRGFPARQRLPR